MMKITEHFKNSNESEILICDHEGNIEEIEKAIEKTGYSVTEKKEIK